jgi:transcriptional regulator with XRE-family HTH domain
VDRLHRQVIRRIADLQREKRLSQNYLADFAGVSRSQMSRMLTGKQSPTLRTLAKIAQALEVDLATLVS